MKKIAYIATFAAAVVLGNAQAATPLKRSPMMPMTAAKASAFKLTSPELKPGQMLPASYEFAGFGCAGENLSPALQWQGAPAGTQSFAVTMYDPDAPTGSGWWHWMVYNLPADTSSLPRGAGSVDAPILPAGAVQQRIDFGIHGYGGVCPPAGRSAEYRSGVRGNQRARADDGLGSGRS